MSDKIKDIIQESINVKAAILKDEIFNVLKISINK